jgi:ABC-2 type transport system permease protein
VSAASQAATPGGPRVIKGPSALGTDPRRFARLTWSLAVTDFKLRFFGSALGYVWTLMRPLLLFGVLLVLFTQILDLGSDVEFYAQALLLGLVLYNFVGEATGASVRSIVDREHIVRKVEFPRLAVPLAVVLQALFNLGLNLIVVLGFALAAGVDVRWTWLEIVPLALILTFFATGLAMLLSISFVTFRDVEPIWDVVLQAGFYLSPIFYTVELVAEKYNASVVEYLMWNPFAAILQQARHAIIDPSHMSAAEAAGGTVNLLVPAFITLAIFAIGGQAFRKRAPRVAEQL